jgi:hypothetical protein
MVLRGAGIGAPSPRYRFCMIFQTNQLRAIENTDLENKGLILQDLQNAGVMVSLEL